MNCYKDAISILTLLQSTQRNNTPSRNDLICVELRAFTQRIDDRRPLIQRFLDNTTDLEDTDLEKWGLGLLFTFLVSACAALGALLFPLRRYPKHLTKCLVWLVSMGVGCLSGLAVFHLVPHSFGVEHSGRPPHIYKAGTIIFSIYLLYLGERFFKLLLTERTRKRCRIPESPDPAPTKYDDLEFIDEVATADDLPVEATKTADEEDDEVSLPQPVRSVAWMVLTGDSLLKFVDGLSIGAAFAVSTRHGVTIATAAFCEELPHELGDMAILVAAGVEMKRAVIYNCATGIWCLLGFIVGAVVGEVPAASSWIFAVAAGMSLYVSLVIMMPEMIADIEAAGEKTLKKGLITLALQNTGFLFGIILMYVLGRYSHRIQI